MGRVVVFLFDETPWRVEAAGAYEMKLERFAEIGVSLERAPDAAWALGDDRVIEVSPPAVHAVPAEFAELIGEHALVYVPITAGGRWLGLIVVSRTQARSIASSTSATASRRSSVGSGLG